MARGLGARFIDGDDLHPVENLAKMASGHPLTDADRAPWLDKVGSVLADDTPTVVGCSALKRVYRDRIIRRAGARVMFLHLAGSRAVIATRMTARAGHFMPPALLDSQFAALEPPGPDEDAITVDIDQPFDVIVASLIDRIGRAAEPFD